MTAATPHAADADRIPHWIAGERADSPTCRGGPVFDPARGVQAATVSLASDAVVDAAVAGAAEAFGRRRDTPVPRRAGVMFAFRALLERRRDALAATITAEHGKTTADAQGEIQRGLEVVDFACGTPHLLKGTVSEQVATGVDTMTVRQPLGVMAGITPFNFPAMVPLWMLPVALTCGNTFVLKPSERDPSTALLLAELLAEAGLPPGVLNVVQGDRGAVARLLDHPGIAAVSFVGSTPVARHIYERGTAAGKRVQALGGAKNHMVVLPDADMELAADAAVSAAYGSAGERCMAVSVVVTVGDAADRLLPLIADRIAKVRVGAGTDPDADMGPLITGEHRDRVVSYVAAGVEAGADLLADGRGVRVDGHPQGFFVGPCLLDHVTPDMSVYTDEIFGPVLSCVRVPDAGEAIDLINRNPYGNGTAVFTNDGGAARAFTRHIEVGMVGVNVPIPVPLAFHSFGGWKQSIFGSHGMYGTDAVHFATRPKVVISRWPDPSHRGVDLGFPADRA